MVMIVHYYLQLQRQQFRVSNDLAHQRVWCLMCQPKQTQDFIIGYRTSSAVN